MTRRFEREESSNRPRRVADERQSRSGATAALALQRSAGNQAVTRLLARKKGSKKVMQDLGTPQVLQLRDSEIAVQDELARELDVVLDAAFKASPAARTAANAQFSADMRGEQNAESAARMERMTHAAQRFEANSDSYESLTYIGAIVLTRPAKTIDELKRSATLVDLPNANAFGSQLKHSLPGGAYDLVVMHGLEDLVIANTLTSMEKARQLEYLVEAGLPDDKHAIVVEVHYYRNRSTGQTKFHKDTKGETLFVNLSFTNKQPMLGPEYIVTPESDEIYEKGVKQQLPEVFVADLEAFKRAVRADKRVIRATVLEPNGIVAFVDEAIHHKTPTPGRRTASATTLADALEKVYGAEYRDAAAAYVSYEKAFGLTRKAYKDYLTTAQAKARSGEWKALLKRSGSLKDVKLDREQLRAWLPATFAVDANDLLEQANPDFAESSRPVGQAKSHTITVRQKGESPLERQASTQNLGQPAVAQGGKRSFFRTWVRAVPRSRLK